MKEILTNYNGDIYIIKSKYDYDLYAIKLNKDKEIERLNNIINELEKFLKDKIDSWKRQNDDEIVKDTIYHERLAVRLIYDYLQELKGDDSNECKRDV